MVYSEDLLNLCIEINYTVGSNPSFSSMRLNKQFSIVILTFKGGNAYVLTLNEFNDIFFANRTISKVNQSNERLTNYFRIFWTSVISACFMSISDLLNSSSYLDLLDLSYVTFANMTDADTNIKLNPESKVNISPVKILTSLEFYANYNVPEAPIFIAPICRFLHGDFDVWFATSYVLDMMCEIEEGTSL